MKRASRGDRVAVVAALTALTGACSDAGSARDSLQATVVGASCAVRSVAGSSRGDRGEGPPTVDTGEMSECGLRTGSSCGTARAAEIGVSAASAPIAAAGTSPRPGARDGASKLERMPSLCLADAGRSAMGLAAIVQAAGCRSGDSGDSAKCGLAPGMPLKALEAGGAVAAAAAATAATGAAAGCLARSENAGSRRGFTTG